MPGAPDPLAEIDQGLALMVFDHRARARARSEGAAALATTGPARAALATVDLDRMEAIAVAVRDGIAKGALGGGGVLVHYPATLAALRERFGSDEPIIDEFLVSGAMARVDCVGTRTGGITVIEAFHDWCSPLLAPPAARTAQHELVAALMRQLAVAGPRVLPVASGLIHRVRSGHVAVLDRAAVVTSDAVAPSRPVLYTANGGAVRSGPVRPLVAAVALRRSERPPAWVDPVLRRHGDDVDVDEVERLLMAKGMV